MMVNRWRCVNPLVRCMDKTTASRHLIGSAKVSICRAVSMRTRYDHFFLIRKKYGMDV